MGFTQGLLKSIAFRERFVPVDNGVSIFVNPGLCNQTGMRVNMISG